MSDRMKIASCKIEMKKQEQTIIICKDIVLSHSYYRSLYITDNLHINVASHSMLRVDTY